MKEEIREWSSEEWKVGRSEEKKEWVCEESRELRSEWGKEWKSEGKEGGNEWRK